VVNPVRVSPGVAAWPIESALGATILWQRDAWTFTIPCGGMSKIALGTICRAHHHHRIWSHRAQLFDDFRLEAHTLRLLDRKPLSP